MPTVDERLERLLADAAVEPTVDGDVFGAVARKRHQRAHAPRGAQRRRRASCCSSCSPDRWSGSRPTTRREPAVGADDSRRRQRASSGMRGSAPVRSRSTPDLGYVRGPLLAVG